jgi:hypothetical protein
LAVGIPDRFLHHRCLKLWANMICHDRRQVVIPPQPEEAC